MTSDASRLVAATCRRYRGCSRYDRGWVRGKLSCDPLHRTLPSRIGRLDGRVVLDLGCGRGIALAVCDTAWELSGTRERPPVLLGIERDARAAAVARAALAARASVETGDVERLTPEPADVVLILDVLHYLDEAAQVRLVGLAARCLRPGGLLLVRDVDANSGVRSRITRLGNRLAAVARGHGGDRFHYRTAAEWARLLQSAGLTTHSSRMSQGTPFANVLVEGRTAAATT